MKRPQPPKNLLGLDPEFDPIDFEPAPELRKWILETFVYEDGPLHNSEHEHIQYFERDFSPCYGHRLHLSKLKNMCWARVSVFRLMLAARRKHA